MVSTRRQSRRRAEADTPPQITPKASMAKLSKGTGCDETPGPSTARVTAPNSVLRSIGQQTPQQKNMVNPAGNEMHLHHHDTSAATDDVDTRLLGFLGMGYNTDSTKKVHSFGNISLPASTPTKKENAQQNSLDYVSPSDNFTFETSLPELSAAAKALMEETRAEAAQIRAQMMVHAPHNRDNDTAGRKIAKPKGKVGRFSDVHMAEFKKMDSILNHGSAWRSDPNRVKPANANSLKRSPSKADLDSPTKAPMSSSLKRSPSKAGLNITSQRTPQKLTTIRTPVAQGTTTSSTKRVKHDATDDATTFRFTRDGRIQNNISTVGDAKHAVLSNLLTPTKASIARSHSTKNLRATNIPSIVRSKSAKDLGAADVPMKEVISNPDPPTQTPVKTTNFLDDSIKMAPLTTTPKSGIKVPMKIKSILRTPRRLYSNDPSKIAAGTHLCTPPDLSKVIPQAPETVPVMKRVNFSASTQLKAFRDEMKAASVEPELLYPVLAPPELGSPNRRMTLSDFSMPSNFTFGAGTFSKFSGPAAVSTIRPVRNSDVSSTENAAGSVFPRKRKAEVILGSVCEDDEDKENGDEVEGEERPSKRMRMAPKPVSTISSPKKPVTKSRLPALKGVVKKGLSASRLNFLSLPKKRI